MLNRNFIIKNYARIMGSRHSALDTAQKLLRFPERLPRTGVPPFAQRRARSVGSGNRSAGRL